MAQTIKIKNSSQALKVPAPGDLAWGEIALNYADGKIYYKKSDATIQSISGGDLASPPAIGGTTPAAGTFTTLTATGQTSLGGVTDSEAFRVLTPVAAAGLRLQVGVPASTVVRLGPAGSTVADFRIITPTFTNFYTGSSSDGLSEGSAQMRVSHTASAVNYVQVTGGATGAQPSISAQGSDAGVSMSFSSKGAGQINFWSNTFGSRQFSITNTTTAVNRLDVTGSTAGSAPILSSQGSDTNISMALQPKGTGAIDLAAGSSGVNISNGGTVTALTRTGQGFNYTSIPAIAISAPTTAGGVQATALQLMYINTAPVTAGGTGYTVGDVLTVVGGTTLSTAATLTISTVSAGVITAVTSTNFNLYSVLPSSPIAVTGGTGSGATFSPLWGNGNFFTITTAGSGYVEQPTVTFSGGGGSGAAAYATVGSGTLIRSLATTMSLSASGGEVLRLSDNGGTSVNYLVGLSGISSVQPQLRSAGETNTNLLLGSNGTGSIRLTTLGGSAIEQFRVAHTASAVNYVQVTGAATGTFPIISAQGSDTNLALQLASKNNAAVILATNGIRQFDAFGPGSAVNFIRAAGNTVGLPPSFTSNGSDTNIDLALTPKGTGAVLINSILGLNAVTASTTATTAAQVLATFDATLYRTVKFVIQSTDATNYHSTEILAIHNGTTASYTEYATVTIGTACAVYSVDYSSATIRLLATPASATATTYKIAAQLTRI